VTCVHHLACWLALGLVACGAPSPAPTIANRAPAAPSSSIVDTDHDGIPDDRDRCPTEPEDYDAFQDADGCPDLDNDGDGVPDQDDSCPYEAGGHAGCPVPCVVTVINSDDCFLDPSVFYDTHDVPQAQRIDEIVRVVRSHPSVQGLEAFGKRAELVAAPLRARLPGIEISENHYDFSKSPVVDVVIVKQRFAQGRFSSSECTPFGAIYSPHRPDNCAQ
jgi:hypothetical protein